MPARARDPKLHNVAMLDTLADLLCPGASVLLDYRGAYVICPAKGPPITCHYYSDAEHVLRQMSREPLW